MGIKLCIAPSTITEVTSDEMVQISPSRVYRNHIEIGMNTEVYEIIKTRSYIFGARKSKNVVATIVAEVMERQFGDSTSSSRRNEISRTLFAKFQTTVDFENAMRETIRTKIISNFVNLPNFKNI